MVGQVLVTQEAALQNYINTDIFMIFGSQIVLGDGVIEIYIIVKVPKNNFT